MKTIDLVAEFHNAFDVPTRGSPAIPSDTRCALRLKLLQEELDELSDAIRRLDLVDCLDALTDLQVVLDGTYLEFGMQGVKDAAFLEVHRSNMSKLGADGKPVVRDDGKVLKGPSYSPPNLSPYINGGVG
jgi:predicted HAD superfamily Cof-like phosphohydrolase